MAMPETKSRINEFLQNISQDLDRCVDFWMKHSLDAEYGGFYNCISKNGDLYDDLKYGWMQGRQTWTFARLYNEVERFKRPDILQAAEKGAEFMMKYQKDPQTWKCYFLMARDGKPKKIQRTIFSECFYLMGMSELARATGKQLYREEAEGMMKKIVYWTQVDDTDIGRTKLTGNEPSSSFAVPMMLLALITQMTTMDPTLEVDYAQLREKCVQDALKHVQRDGSVILENVSLDGKELPGSAGRLLNPGHSIEGGWFLLQVAQTQNDASLKETALEKFIVKPFNYGWDSNYGGLFYFLDVDGHSPCQLEWDMKLFWVHNEAMIAFLMAYEDTGKEEFLERFAQLFDYCYSHFVDKENGEWVGYLNRQGEVSMDFKGGAFKGCFHVPRCLYMCEQILLKLKAQQDKN